MRSSSLGVSLPSVQPHIRPAAPAPPAAPIIEYEDQAAEVAYSRAFLTAAVATAVASVVVNVAYLVVS